MRARTPLVWAVGLTALHLGYRVVEGRPEKLGVTTKEAPFTVDAGILRDMGLDPAECELLVFFQPDCPYCQSAATTERSRSQLARSATWISEIQSEADRFAGQPHPTSRVLSSPQAWRAFGIRAVPAGFLVFESMVSEAWRYRGDEDHGELKQTCPTEESSGKGVTMSQQ